MQEPPVSSIPQGRRNLAAVARQANDLIRIDDVVAALAVNRPAATKMLWRWVRQGWLRRVGPGTYALADLGSIESEHILDDPWVLVPTLFGPAYIGGWSAADHWELTEQLFRPIVVMTTRPVHGKHREYHGTPFLLRHVLPRKLFGTTGVWRGNTRVPVANVHRTIVDVLDEPSIGAGIQHVADCVAAYLRHDDRDDDVLVAYAETLGNGAVFKRLGFLVEERGEASLADTCRARITKGYAKLDPALPCSRPVSKWRLKVPARWPKAAKHD